MRKNNCELIRRELDELMLGEAHSSAATHHLRECASCREFHEQTTKLRHIVGSLGTVEAPADFDFRLRARLASQASSSVSSIYWPFARRGLALAAMVLLFATGAVVLRNILDKPASVNEVAQQPKVEQPPQKQVEELPVAKENGARTAVIANAGENDTQSIRKLSRPRPDYKKRSVAAMDFSSERANVIGEAGPVGVPAAFPIDASLQSFKVSLNDERGNEKTISVPTISFGSQRIVQGGNQFAPKRDW